MDMVWVEGQERKRQPRTTLLFVRQLLLLLR
jgi:hypothetical protein